MNNLPKAEHEAPQPGIEPATFQLQVRRPKHCATTLHNLDSVSFFQHCKIVVFYVGRNLLHPVKVTQKVVGEFS